MLVSNSYNSTHHVPSQFLTSTSYNKQINSPQNNTSSQSSSLDGSTAMSQIKLVPSLRVKSNEFFFKWITDKERGDQLNEIIGFIKANNRIPKASDLQFKVSYDLQLDLSEAYIKNSKTAVEIFSYCDFLRLAANFVYTASSFFSKTFKSNINLI